MKLANLAIVAAIGISTVAIAQTTPQDMVDNNTTTTGDVAVDGATPAPTTPEPTTPAPTTPPAGDAAPADDTATTNAM